MENRKDLIEAILPKLYDNRVKESMLMLNCNNVILLKITPKPLTRENDCHYNVLKHVKQYGGSQLKGYYLAVDKYSSTWVALGHSVWVRDGELLDITPVSDSRTHNVFIWNSNQETEIESYIVGGIKQDFNVKSLKGYTL